MVTVVIPSFNKADQIARTLASVAAQEGVPVELVVVDDSSTDESQRVIAGWADDAEVPTTSIFHERNTGICATVNDGVAIAKGEFIVVLGADDRLLPGMLERQVRLLRTEPDAAFCYGDARIVDLTGTTLHESFIQIFRGSERPQGMIFKNLIEKLNFIPTPAATIRASSLRQVGAYDESLFFEDFDMWIRLARVGKVIYSGEVDAEYTAHPQSFTRIHGSDRAFMETYVRIFAKWRNDPLVSGKTTRGWAAVTVMGMAGNSEVRPASALSALRAGFRVYPDWRVVGLASYMMIRAALGKQRRRAVALATRKRHPLKLHDAGGSPRGHSWGSR